MEKDLYTIREAAEILNLKTNKLMYLIRTNRIKARKIGWIWVLSQTEVKKLEGMLNAQQ